MEPTNVTVRDLIAKQDEVARLEDEACAAFVAVGRAERDLQTAKTAHESARWLADESATELRELVESVRELKGENK